MERTNRTLEEDLNALIGDLCVKEGFCNRLSGENFVRDGRTVSADEFTKAVLEAEGMDPAYEIEWFRKIKQRFSDRYGNSVSHATFSQVAR